MGRSLGIEEVVASKLIGAEVDATQGHDGRAVANYVLAYCEARERHVTNLALQKILYFCHAWSLLNLKRPLVKHEFEAWKHGPVLQYLYREFKDFDDSPITRQACVLNTANGKKIPAQCEFESDERQLLNQTIDFYSRLSAGQLVEMSHIRGGPWHAIWNHSGKINPGMKIRNEQIVSFYSRAVPRLGIQ